MRLLRFGGIDHSKHGTARRLSAADRLVGRHDAESLTARVREDAFLAQCLIHAAAP